MPTLGNALDFAKYEGRNLRAHQLGTAPGSPVTGQLFYNTADNTLYWWDGSAWVSARGGASTTPPATTGALGTVQLAGDLAGTATSPQIAAGVITDAEVAAANKDGAAATPGMRTVGIGGAQQALPGNANIAQMNLPSTSVDFNGKKIFNLADATNDTDAANKRYVDNIAQGLDAKPSVKAASTGILTLSSTQTVDGVALVANDRVLVKDQSTASTNGVYVVAAGAWTRATDMDAWGEVPGAFVFVEQGTVNADTGWVCTADAGGTIGTNAMPWTQFSGAGSFTAGAGLSRTGNILDVGQGAGIAVLADTVGVANDGITNAMLADGAVDLASADVTGALPLTKGGTGGTTAAGARAGLGTPRWYTIDKPPSGSATLTVPYSEHGCNNGRGNLVQVSDNTTGAVELPDVVIASNGDVTITYGASVTANSKRVTVVGL